MPQSTPALVPNCISRLPRASPTSPLPPFLLLSPLVYQCSHLFIQNEHGPCYRPESVSTLAFSGSGTTSPIAAGGGEYMRTHLDCCQTWRRALHGSSNSSAVLSVLDSP